MSDKPGFSVRKVDLDDDVIEIESNPEAEAEELVEIVELRELLDELREELKKSRDANEKLVEKFETQRAELTEARVELAGLADRRRFISDGRGGEIEISTYNDLTRDQAPE